MKPARVNFVAGLVNLVRSGQLVVLQPGGAMILWPPMSGASARFAILSALILAGCASPNSRLALPKGSGPIAGGAAPGEATEAEQTFWDRLAQTRVIYIGETHNSNSDHEYQLDILKGLKARGENLAIGWEMFEVTQQPMLDQWQARQIGSDALLERANWRRSWGAQSVMYETILRWSLAENVPCVALNAPGGLSHKVAFDQPLSAEERAMLPTGFEPLPGGLEHFTEQMARTPHAASGANPESFYKAQLVWEQTMASRIVDFAENHPDQKLIVLAGRGHLEGGYGIPAFVRQKSSVRQLVLFPTNAAPGAAANPGSLANGWRRTHALALAFSNDATAGSR